MKKTLMRNGETDLHALMALRNFQVMRGMWHMNRCKIVGCDEAVENNGFKMAFQSLRACLNLK
jgi:hypothetical protein